MVATETRVTKAQVVKLAKARYPGKEIKAEHHPSAMTREERSAAILRNKARRELLALLKAEAEKTGKALADLANSARFVVDVNGDSPSIPNLSFALAQAEAHLELLEEKRQVEYELSDKHPDKFTWGSRFEVWYRGRGDFGWHGAAAGDSWEDCSEKLNAE